MKETQLAFIVKQLKKNGYITRNQCLRNYISRLGARIIDLKKEGWQFMAGFMKNGDYRYQVIKRPRQ